jgi:UDP-glucose 6-dehydrogenase
MSYSNVYTAILEAEALVSAFDPESKRSRLLDSKRSNDANSIPACLSGAQCCAVVTKWEQFKALTPDDSVERHGAAVVFDAYAFLIRNSFATGRSSARLA